MATKLHFAYFCCALYLSFNPISAANEPTPFENNPILTETCTAPPPDSFRVTSRGPGFISVAWAPVWPDAQHTMYIFTRTNTTDWVPLDTVYNLPGSAYTYENMAFETDCRLEIATNCASGEPGVERNNLQDKIIIELTTGGGYRSILYQLIVITFHTLLPIG